jgi:hypothetical protein
MPILDIECVLPAGSTAALAGPAQRLAETAGRALTQAVAESLGVDAQRVHVQMAPAAAGRQAFGGRLVE